MRVQTRILQAIFEWKRLEEEKECGTVECCDRSGVFESVELERGWFVRGLYGHFPVADFDVLLLQECFRKLDGVNVGTHELFTPSELLGGLRCPAVIVNQKWKGQSKIVGDAARWTAVELDGQLTLISAHLPHKGKKLVEFEAALMEI